MKIQGPGSTTGTQGVSKTDKKKKTGSSGFDGMVDDGAEAGAQSSPVTGSSPVARLDTLLTIQEAGDGTTGGESKGKKRAAAILAELEKVRLGILSGGIPKTALQHISRMVGQHRDTVMDPALGEILDEIDLRAQVELAKHDR